jgi:hypothetical protein
LHIWKGRGFGFYKWKPSLFPKLEGDSHKHDHVNFSHPLVNTQIGKLHLQCEHPSFNVDSYEVVDTTNGDVEVFEVPYGDGV